jgi:hypothetical protein
MLLNENPHRLLQELGHSGLEITYPDKPKPYCYRGHHIQEILDVCFRRDVYLTLVQPLPMLPEGTRVYTYEQAEKRWEKLIMGNPAILIGANHACAWDGEHVYDPNGRIYKITNFLAREAWVKFT